MHTMVIFRNVDWGCNENITKETLLAVYYSYLDLRILSYWLKFSSIFELMVKM